MFFAQTTATATATGQAAAEVRENVDTRTTRASNAAGVKGDPNDARTTRDDDYDPKAAAEAEDEGRATLENPLFGTSLSLAARAELEGGPTARAGGTDYIAQIAFVEGYNDNVEQTQAVVNGPVTRHPSPFTGVDASITVRTFSSENFVHELRLQVRGQVYTPIEDFSEPADGAVVGSYQGEYLLSRRDTVDFRVLGTVATLNSARLSDGPVFLVEPGSLQRTYTLETARASITHELTPRLRYRHAVDSTVSTTIHDTPIDLGDGVINHRGIDYVEYGTDGTLFYDLSESDTLLLSARYTLTRNYFLIDFSQNPPQYAGIANTHLVDGSIGLNHGFSQSLHLLTTVGAIVSSAPPLDPDTSLVASPLFSVDLLYQRRFWIFNANAGYTYGAVSPRLGFGPTASAALSLQGTPFWKTYRLRDLAVLVNAQAVRSAFSLGANDVSQISYVATTAEIRFPLNNWLGILGGYDFRYAVFRGADAFPTLVRNVVFLGLSGYWSTDRVPPTLETFVAPVTSG